MSKKVDNSLKNKVDFSINCNKSLSEHTIKEKIVRLLSKHKHETIFINMKNSKMNEPHKFVFGFPQGSDLKSWNKHFALQNMFISYAWKNIRQQFKNKKNQINNNNVE